MKKLLSIILSAAMLSAAAATVSANEIPSQNAPNCEYVMPMVYKSIERLPNSYMAYDKQDKCAIYGLDGKKLSEDYDYIGEFYNNQVAEARKDSENYIINRYGTVIGKFAEKIIGVSDYVLMNLSDANNDGRPFSYYEGEFGVYTYTGEFVNTLPYEKYKPNKNAGFWITFSNGRMVFQESGKWGAVDNSFNTVIEPIYDKIYPFSAESGVTMAIKNGKYGLIDKNGKTLADFIYDEMQPIYHSKRKNVNAYKIAQNSGQETRYGLLDENGKMIKQLDELVPCALYDEYKLIKVYIPNNRDDSADYESLYGFIDYDGNIVIPVENTNIWNISDGIVAAEKSYDHCGYYDIDGNEITEFKYRLVSPFSDGLAFASSCIDDTWTHEVINKKGEVIFNPDNWSNGFYGGIAYIETGKFIDTDGNIVIDNPDWKFVSGVSWWNYKDGGTFIVSDGENYGVAKYNGFVSPWAKAAVAQARDISLTDANKNYNYTGYITREEFCELIFNYINNFSQSAVSPATTKTPFDDTNNEHIAALTALGIINGKTNTEFAPNDCLTREEAATILNRLIKNMYPNSAATEIYFNFADSEQFSDWAASNIQIICNMGIMQGVGNNMFAPQEIYTTEQAIATLVRVYNNLENAAAFSNAENMSYSQIEALQESVNNGHFPWRLDYEQVIMSFLSSKGEEVENGNLVALDGNEENCSGSCKIGNSVYTLELFKPIDKTENGIWIVKSYDKKDIIGGADDKTEINVGLADDNKLNTQ